MKVVKEIQSENGEPQLQNEMSLLRDEVSSEMSEGQDNDLISATLPGETSSDSSAGASGANKGSLSTDDTESRKSVDQKLVERVQRGDKKAFDILVLKYQHKVIKLISRYVRDEAETLDIAQEAFIKAYRALPRFRGDSAFYTWLYRIAINTAKNFLVSQGRRPPATDLDITEAEQFVDTLRLRDINTPERLLLKDEIEKVVFKSIEQLPEDLRTAISLRELEGLSYEEIALAMDCPVGTVRSRIFRAREVIDKKLAPLLE